MKRTITTTFTERDAKEQDDVLFSLVKVLAEEFLATKKIDVVRTSINKKEQVHYNTERSRSK